MPRISLAPDVQVSFRLPGRTPEEVLSELQTRLTAQIDAVVDSRLVPLLRSVETRDSRMRIGQSPADPDVYSTYQVFAVRGETTQTAVELERGWDLAADDIEAAIRSSLSALGATVLRLHRHNWEESLDVEEPRA